MFAFGQRWFEITVCGGRGVHVDANVSQTDVSDRDWQAGSREIQCCTMIGPRSRCSDISHITIQKITIFFMFVFKPIGYINTVSCIITLHTYCPYASLFIASNLSLINLNAYLCKLIYSV